MKEKKAAAKSINYVPIVSLGIFLCALVVRLLYILQVRHTPVLDFLYIDSAYYHAWATAIAHGDILGGTQIFVMAPFYAYFLALIYRIVGNQYITVLFIQIVIGSLSCVLLARIAQKYFDNRTAVIAGLIGAVYPIFIFYDAVLLKENLMIFFLLVFIVLYTKGSSRALLASGICIGINALMRPTIFLALPLLIGYDFVKHREHMLKNAVLLAAGVFIVVFPVALRNRMVGGEWVVTVASGGMNFWTGNNLEATGAYVGAPFITSEEPQFEQEDFRREASKLSGRSLSADQTSDFWYHEGIHFIVNNPSKYMWLLWRKFVAFWHDTELPSDINFYLARDYSTILNNNPLTFGVIVPFSVIGMILARKKVPLNYLLLTLVGTNLLASLIFFNSSRYRLPVVPIFILYAAYALARCIDFITTENYRSFTLLFIAVPVFVFCNYHDRFLSRFASTRVSYLNAASYYMRSGANDKAEMMLKKCLEIDPQYPLAYQKYAQLLAATGRKEEAATFMGRALHYASVSGDKRAFKSMPELEQAYLLFSHKKYTEALSLFREIRTQHPEMKKVLDNNIGLCYLKLGDYLSAEQSYVSAIEIDPAYDTAYYNLGILYRKKGDRATAKEYFKKALKANPANEKAKLRLQE
ncbi:MAG: tetratricopeptide repeat protein [Endomicrobiales bacterium]|jgi:tetratricopeptide (TPR) repeat protein